MPRRRRARILLAVLLVGSILLVTWDLRSGPGGGVDRLRDGAASALRPVQEIVVRGIRPVRDAASDVGDLLHLRSENRRLRREIDRLQGREPIIAGLERENDQLRELLGVRGRMESDTVAGRAVAAGPSNVEWTLTIDVGADAGIERDMPVVDGSGLVGRVVAVGPDVSRVLLATDPGFSAAARVAGTGEIGTVDGRGDDPMRWRPLAAEPRVEVGDAIVTESFQGGLFPAGIPVGTVVEVGEAADAEPPEVLVEPAVDVSRLDHVLVVRTGSGADPGAPG